MNLTAVRAAAAVTVAVVAGAVAGQIFGSDDSSKSTRAVRVGDATFNVHEDWKPVERRDGTTVLADGDDRMTLAFGPATDRTLAPAGAPVRGEPRTVDFAGYRTWAYGDTTVLPSAHGTAACLGARCRTDVSTVWVAGAAILTPTPDLALRLKAPEVLATLDAERVRGRDALRDATNPAGPASDLERAHETAGNALRPFAPQGSPLISALDDAAGAYGELSADRQGNGSSPLDEAKNDAAGGTSGQAIDRADAAVARAVAALAATGVPRAQRPARPAPVASTGPSTLTLSLVLALAFIALALLPFLIARIRRPAPATAAATAPQPAGGARGARLTQLAGRELQEKPANGVAAAAAGQKPTPATASDKPAPRETAAGVAGRGKAKRAAAAPMAGGDESMPRREKAAPAAGVAGQRKPKRAAAAPTAGGDEPVPRREKAATAAATAGVAGRRKAKRAEESPAKAARGHETVPAAGVGEDVVGAAASGEGAPKTSAPVAEEGAPKEGAPVAKEVAAKEGAPAAPREKKAPATRRFAPSSGRWDEKPPGYDDPEKNGAGRDVSDDESVGARR